VLEFVLTVLTLSWWVVPGCVAVDAARRGRSWFGWAFLVCATTVVGLVIWLVARSRTPPGQAVLGRGRTALLWFAGASILPLGLILASWTITFAGQIAHVNGQAMAPTIENQDVVLVNKMAYRATQPQRGDVVMLLYPVNPDKKFVKRLIAVAGDTVGIRDGTVFVNDVPRADNEIPAASRSHDDWGPQIVPEGYCFVLGDKRNNSSDSRHWGFVPIKYVLGRVAYRLSGARPFTAVR
jgi:signal peptidase I